MPCQKREPTNTAPITNTISAMRAKVVLNLRLRRTSFARTLSARLIPRRGCPTASGSVRWRPHSLGIGRSTVLCDGVATLVEPRLQDANGGRLVDHRLLSFRAHSGLAQ